MPRPSYRLPSEQPFVFGEDLSNTESSVIAFHRRQQKDLKRYHQGATDSNQHESLHEKKGCEGYEDQIITSHSAESTKQGSDGDGWRDSEGDKLDDFGVDESAESYGEDDIPLTDLLRRRHVRENW